MLYQNICIEFQYIIQRQSKQRVEENKTMSTLEELGLDVDETPIEIPDEVPEETSGYIPMVQPGSYILKLPDDMETVWTKIDTKDKGVRISAGFKKDNPITVYQDDKFAGEFNSSPVTTFINNNEFPRGREKVPVSDMFYMIRALEANLPDEEKSLLTNNASYVSALKKHSGKLFIARISWKAYCNPNKNIYLAIYNEDGTTDSVDEQEGTPGCGAEYTNYSKDVLTRIPKNPESGRFKERFEEYEAHGQQDGCPARLMCNVRLGKFTAVTK